MNSPGREKPSCLERPQDKAFELKVDLISDGRIVVTKKPCVMVKEEDDPVFQENHAVN
jgi:hypothetical protein